MPSPPLATSGLAQLASLLVLASAPAATPRPANIVVILSDDQGYADMAEPMHGPGKRWSKETAPAPKAAKQQKKKARDEERAKKNL